MTKQHLTKYGFWYKVNVVNRAWQYGRVMTAEFFSYNVYDECEFLYYGGK